MQLINGHPGKMAEAAMVLEPFLQLRRQFGLCHEAVVAGKVMGTSEGVQQVLMFQAQEVQDLTRDDLPFGGPFIVQVFWKSHDSELSFQDIPSSRLVWASSLFWWDRQDGATAAPGSEADHCLRCYTSDHCRC